MDFSEPYAGIVYGLHFLTQLQRGRVQGQICIISVLRLAVMAAVITAQPPQSKSLPGAASPDRKQVSEHWEEGNEISLEELQKIIVLTNL